MRFTDDQGNTSYAKAITPTPAQRYACFLLTHIADTPTLRLTLHSHTPLPTVSGFTDPPPAFEDLCAQYRRIAGHQSAGTSAGFTATTHVNLLSSRSSQYLDFTLGIQITHATAHSTLDILLTPAPPLPEPR